MRPETTPPEDGTLCTVCRRLPTRCSYCDREVEGRFKRYETGEVLCSGCEFLLPPCARCGKRCQGGPRKDGLTLCPDCAKQVVPCRACGKPIVGEAVFLPSAPARKFHRACFDQGERCDACEEPVALGGRRLPDGRLICATCQETLVTTPEQVLRLEEKIKKIAFQEIGLRFTHAVSFHLADAKEVAQLAGTQFVATPGFDERTQGLFVRQGDSYRIHVEDHLPLAITARVLSHELGHAWQAENCPDGQGKLLREGFAEWVAWRVLRALGYAREVARMEARTDVYGQGLAKMRQIERERDVAGLLEWVRRVV